MDQFDGTLARQLDLPDDGNAPLVGRTAGPRPAGLEGHLRLLQKDIYLELARRRRRAQITARRLLELEKTSEVFLRRS